jgi:hypothetical protein
MTTACSASSLLAVALPMPPAPPVIQATRRESGFSGGWRWSLASSSDQYSMLNASFSGSPTYSLIERAPRMTLMALT